MEKRRFSRVGLAEKSIVEHNGHTYEVSVEDISLKGALVRFADEATFRRGDRLDLSFLLGGSEISLRFSAEVVHARDNLAGVKFIETNLDTMIHLRGILEARTLDPDRIQSELVFLIDEEV